MLSSARTPVQFVLSAVRLCSESGWDSVFVRARPGFNLSCPDFAEPVRYWTSVPCTGTLIRRRIAVASGHSVAMLLIRGAAERAPEVAALSAYSSGSDAIIGGAGLFSSISDVFITDVGTQGGEAYEEVAVEAVSGRQC